MNNERIYPDMVHASLYFLNGDEENLRTPTVTV